jgi:hypothetical protein
MIEAKNADDGFTTNMLVCYAMVVERRRRHKRYGTEKPGVQRSNLNVGWLVEGVVH